MTVMDEETLGLTDQDQDVFFIASSTNIMADPQITLNKRTKVTAQEYVRILNDKGDWCCEPTEGMGISGIATGCYWFIRKIKTVMEMMYGM